MSISAEKLNKLRIQNGWSQERLAEISGLSLRTIQRLEKGETASLESQQAISKAFDIPPSELLEDTEVQIGEGGINWSGISGVLVITALVISMFELGGGVVAFIDKPSIILSVFIPLGMAAISLGGGKTLDIIKLMRFIFVLPKHEKGLHTHVSSLNWLIFYCYAAGFISTLIGVVAVLFYPVDFAYQGELANRHPTLFGMGIAFLTLVYSSILAELFIRPLKHQIERLIIHHSNYKKCQ
ncbi:helix-turn-helix domain-containing protein [Pseudoalteromonas aurantia]|uniref:HTH cro/C1-type domain-containing protein n=1 Tax=Pseudoalteromonas aurantia TaxID=43654 RepID=A0A5S3V5S4_9GAMM|nr:helix-turn-helix transcriptional regulator [Pseudoalteromonas aurantia]TMO65824.1 hypothetical protein CWC19_17200 [Pseudoalteromonas aurantia]